MTDKNNFDQNQHAIVLGGSISGLLAARVLSDHFAAVTIIERDQLPADNRIRKGAPQAKHLHILLAQGAKIMGELFPELGPKLDDLGAPLFDLTEETSFTVNGKSSPLFSSGVYSRSINRATLEAEVRRLTKKIPNIKFRERTDVLQLVGNEANTAVTGVMIRNRFGEKQQEMVTADFVVDATGRRSKAPQWLAQMGYAPPEETIIDATVGYATRIFQPQDDFNPSWRIRGVLPECPSKSRGGGMCRQEDGTIIMTLLGMAGDLPPLDEPSFASFARDVHPEFVDIMTTCKPITPITGYRKLENQWRHYEKLSHMPDRFTVIGDAFCAFNPIYGQGMSAAALEAVKLGDLLQRANGRLDGLASRFIRALPAVVFPAWMLATGEDLRWPTTTGKPNSIFIRFAPWLSTKVVKSGVRSQTVAQAFIEVQNLLATPLRFFRPWTFAAIMWHSWRAQREERRDKVMASAVVSPKLESA